MPDRVELQPGAVVIRHVRLPFAGEALSGGVAVLGQTLYPMPREGVNGVRGFVGGTYEPRLGEHGTFSLRFPNAAGEDGVLHRERFLILRNGRRTWVGGATIFTVAGGTYRPGDEWIEVYRVTQGYVGDLLFVGTPTGARVTQNDVVLSGGDGAWLGRKSRETAAGFWHHAPRDAFEFYTQAWAAVIAEGFDALTVAATGADADTSDGRLNVRNASTNASWPSALAVTNGGGVGQFGRVRSSAARAIPFGIGAPADVRHAAWRVEATVRFAALGDTIEVGMFDYAASHGYYLVINPSGIVNLANAAVGTLQAATNSPILPGRHAFAIEGRGRWVYYYLDGELVGCLPGGTPSYTDGRLFVDCVWGNGQTNVIYVENFLVRRTRPFLLRSSGARGDFRLPGSLPAGGLVGTYFDDTDLDAAGGTVRQGAVALNPTRKPYARRQDPVPYFADAQTPAGPPGSPPRYSIRYAGAIYLDLATSDYFLRYGTSLPSPRQHVYVGKTRPGEEYIAATGAAGPSLRTHLGGSVSGWYPLLIEVIRVNAAAGGAPNGIEWATAAGGPWSAVPANMLSPLGIYEDQVRYESFGEELTTLADTFGLQWTCAPRQLESGEFPGLIVPRVREGRDTEKVIDFLEASQIAVDLNAEETSDALIADASGIADPKGGGQLTMEAFNFAELDDHLIVHSEYDSLSEIQVRALLEARLTSELLLRGSAWEQVAAQPRGRRELLDAFPLSGALAEFAWRPGDGVRIWLGEIGVEDRSPRQIMGVSWPFTPDGLQAPTVAFRQRPRGLGELLREMLRTQLRSQRNYQGTLVTVPGNSFVGNVNQDPYVRLAMPPNVDDIVSATFVVLSKTDTSTWNIEVNGSNRLTFTLPGRYDITPWVARYDGVSPQCYTRAVGGTGSIQYVAEILVRT